MLFFLNRQKIAGQRADFVAARCQRNFGALSLSDVHVHPHHSDGLALRITQQFSLGEQPVDGAVRPDHAELTIAWITPLPRLLSFGSDSFAVFRMNQLEPLLEGGTDIARGKA